MNEPKPTTPDLTKVLDPEALWTYPGDCPDWPLFRDEYSKSMNGPRTRQDAESRLYSLSRQLHGNATPRDPTTAERKSALAQLFADPTTGNWKNWQFEALGLPFRPANHSVDAQARAVVEAAHIRGHLRKLDAATAAEAKRKTDAAEARLRNTAESWPARESALQAELDALSEAAARHEQRIADETAFRRLRDLRSQLAYGRSEAQKAANELGIAEPSTQTAPEVEEPLLTI